MWLLGSIATHHGGDLVPEDDNHWQCYIDLLRIMSIVTAVEVTENFINILTMLIECYLSTFNALFLIPSLQRCITYSIFLIKLRSM